MGEIYSRAERLGLDIVAEVYNILLFTMDTGKESYGLSEAYSECKHRGEKKDGKRFCGIMQMPCCSGIMRSAMEC